MCLKSGNLAQGSMVAEFEHAFAEYIGVKHAVAVTSGTVALHLAMMALDIKQGDEVITSPFSFIASANCAIYVGATPVFVDINKDDFCIDLNLIERKITPRTKAIIPVHLYGQTCDMEKLMDIARRHNLYVVEDACQAHGAKFNMQKAGSFGDLACFSFYATKNMTTGEGGMLTTNNDAVFEKLKLLRNHGQSVRYYHEITGYNFRMTDINAAIGIEQLKKLDSLNSKRKENAAYLSAKLENVPGIKCPNTMPNREHVFHQFTILVEDQFPVTRDALIDILKKDGINSGLHYPVLLSDQKSVKEYLNGVSETFEVAEDVTKRVLSLPIHPALTTEDLNYIAKVLYDIKK